ncbi:MAG: PD-(D/E)XK nuclease family protein [Elusimicrobia bacterium]|nr:PD-(D/E)XK nuclease family protein [Elusimicrobiota bacterium]
MRALSHSAISMYLDCPQKYKFKYVDRIPEKPKHFFSFGQTVHQALEFFYGVPVPPPPSLKELLDFYKKNWRSAGYETPEQEAQYLEEGRRILTAFHQKHVKDYKLPFFAEYAFHLEVGGVPVTGKVDRIDKLEDSRLAVVDYKTGKAFDISRVEKDTQLTMYQMACEELLGMPVAQLTFYHLPSLTELTVRRHPDGQVQAWRKRIVDVAEDIGAKKFLPKPEDRKCSWCDYKGLCPAWQHQENLLDGKAGAPEKELGESVDRYGALKDQIKDLEAEAEKVRQEIVEALERLDFLRAFGKKYEVSRSLEEKWEFKDKRAVLEVFKAGGLYEKVLAPSAAEIQKIMRGNDLSPAVRAKLENLGRKIQTILLRYKRLENSAGSQ